MKFSKSLAIAIATLIIFSFALLAEEKKEELNLNYPEAKKIPVVDNYSGKKITDVYRWLEDFDNKDVQKWAKAQNEITRSVFNNLPIREKLKERMLELIAYPRQSAYKKKGDYYFFMANTGLQNQDILYRKKGIDGKPVMVIDPLKLGKDKSAAMNWYYISPNGEYLAYGISTHGDEQAVLYVKDIDTGKDLSEAISGCRFGNVVWTSDNEGFYYPRFPDPKTVKKGHENFFPKIFHHKLGDDYKNDKMLHEDPEKAENLFMCDTSDDDRYVVIYSVIGTKEESEVYIYDTKNDKKTKLFSGYDAEYILNFYKGRAFLRTTKDAPKYKLVEIDLNKPAAKNWKTVLPEKDSPLLSVKIVKDKIVAEYLEKAQSKLFIYDLNGKFLKDVSPPVIANIHSIEGGAKDDEIFYLFYSFTVPQTVYKVDMDTLELSKVFVPKLKFDSSNFNVEQVWYKSKDGTKVSMFLVYKKGIKKTGNNPLLLKGYGGFNVNYIPRFYAEYLPYFEQGGILAVPNLRGGGEYGREWHEDGMLDKKQNVFDDYIYAAEYLIIERWTSSDNLCILGGSNGGLLTGAAMVQRPDLFKAIISYVPLLDMLRYHKFSIGRYWIPEYGSADNPEQFDFIRAYSPYHNIDSTVSYPALYITAGASDSRVVPLHAMKFAAAIQNDTKTTEPVLLWVEYKSGHGQGKPLNKKVDAAVDMFTFIFWQLGMDMK